VLVLEKSGLRLPGARGWIACLTLLLGGCVSTVQSRVIDDVRQRPIAGAMVTATWWEHASRSLTCYHAETAATNQDGVATMTASVRPPTQRAVWGNLGEHPSMVVYARGYETSLARLRAAGMKFAVVHSRSTEDLSLLPKERTRYLVPSTMDRNDRITYLRVLGDAALCLRNEAPRSYSVRFLQALKDEADQIAVTDYDRFVGQWLAFLIALARGEPRPDAPPYGGVITAAINRSPRQLAAALGSPTADPDDRDTDGRTALMHACFYGLPSMVNMLLDAGADPGRHDFNDGYNALHAAVQGASGFAVQEPARRTAYIAVVERLLRSPRVDPEAHDARGISARATAQGAKQLEILELMTRSR
jgi:ankyrin repeat protein